MSTSKSPVFLPVVAAEDYRHAVPGELWELRPICLTGPVQYRSAPRDDSADAIMRLAEISLQVPIDFPSIGEAILEGDHIALAVDPSVPRVSDVIAGVLRALKTCGASRVSIVLWAEASEAAYQSLARSFQNTVTEETASEENTSEKSTTQATDSESSASQTIATQSQPGEMIVAVSRHAPRDRREMRYVAADAGAEAIYLARDLVDADFAIPIVAARSVDAVESLDPMSVFPMFADASTMRRFQTENPPAEFQGMAREVGWLLGVQLVMMVSSDADGSVARIVTGTPDAIRSEIDTLHSEEKDAAENETRPTAGLIVASLDGDASVQTWANVARAVIAASRHIEGDGSIVVWSRLTEPPPPVWQREIRDAISHEEETGGEFESGDHRETDDDVENETESETKTLDFADWSTDSALARRLAGLLTSYRVFLHSELDDADVESLGIGVVASVEELRRLGEAFQGAGMLRAAHFHDGSITRIGKSAE